MTLTPATAAQIASAVYGIRELSNVERGIARQDHVLTILLRTVVGQANTAISRRDQDA